MKTLAAKIKKNKVIAYTGKFGTGKTKALDDFFSSEESKLLYKPIKFNAWEFDYANNPKLVFINELLISIYKELGMKETSRKIMMEALEITGNLIFNFITDNLNKVGINFSRDEKKFDEMIKEYKTEKSKIAVLRKNITKLVSHSKKQVVIIIDDLDRARPDFSLEIFEIAKHIFAVENISLILVYDTNTMNNIIENKYGRINGESYLNKYIDFVEPHKVVTLTHNIYNGNYFDYLITSYPKEISIRTISKFKENYDTNVVISELSFYRSRDLLYIFFLFIKMINPEYLVHKNYDSYTKYYHKDKILEVYKDLNSQKIFDSHEWDKLIDFIHSLRGNETPANEVFKEVYELEPKFNDEQ